MTLASHRARRVRLTPLSSQPIIMNNSGREEIVDKLHGALAAFRRERDDLHRKKELANERLRLVTEERVSLEKTIRDMQQKLNVLNESVSNEGKQQLAVLEQEVERLNKENQFQHSELIGKKEKIRLLEEKIDEETKSREASLCAARDAVKKRRNKVATQGKPDHSTEKQVQIIEKEKQEVDNDRVWSKWPRLVEQKAAAITMEAADLHRFAESLRNVIAGYKKHFGDVGVNENTHVPMKQ